MTRKARETAHPGWVQWLNARPPGFYLCVAVLFAAAITAFVLWIEPATLALVAALSFLSMLARLVVTLRSEWRTSETSERVIGIVGCLMLLGAGSANIVRYLLLR